jgi:type IV pilus assembly protein PilW
MPKARPQAQAGVSLIETLVALAVGLVVSVVALGSAQTFSGISRMQSGQGSALAAAASAMDAIRHDVQLSGLGFYSDSGPLCGRINLVFEGSVLRDAAEFVPLRIAPGSGASDTLEISYARDVTAGAAFRLLASSTQAMGPAVLGAGTPIQAGDVVMLASPSSGAPCTLATAGSTVLQAGGRVQVAFSSPGGFTPASWDGVFSELPTYTDTARLAVLGALNWLSYEVQGDRLERLDRLSGQRSVIARGVVQLRAQYGLAATSGENTLSQWVDAQAAGGLSASDWDRLRALRVAVVAINGEAERPDLQGRCQATTAAPLLWDGEAADITGRAGWQCHRYRVWSTWVGLRNLQWGLGR